MSDDHDPDRAGPHGPSGGLFIRPGNAKFTRPAAGLTAQAVRPSLAQSVTLAAALPALRINSHRALATQQAVLAERVAKHPDIAVMFLINPVLAFKLLGVSMSTAVASHVLHAIQHPIALRTRREELEAKLKEALGEVARPTDPLWNAHLLFKLRGMAALEIGDLRPTYGPPLGQTEAQKLHALRPPATLRYPQPRRLAPRARVGSVAWKESLRRIDLKAPTPKLPQATCRPDSVPLEDLWFYKDLDELVHDALELGIIQRRAFPVHSPDSFRQVLAGSKPNAFRSWVTSLRFKPA